MRVRCIMPLQMSAGMSAKILIKVTLTVNGAVWKVVCLSYRGKFFSISAIYKYINSYNCLSPGYCVIYVDCVERKDVVSVLASRFTPSVARTFWGKSSSFLIVSARLSPDQKARTQTTKRGNARKRIQKHNNDNQYRCGPNLMWYQIYPQIYDIGIWGERTRRGEVSET